MIDWQPTTWADLLEAYRDMLRLADQLREDRPQSETAAAFGDAASTINTIGKFEGKSAWDSTNLRILYATGSAATDDWNTATGTSAITPS